MGLHLAPEEPKGEAVVMGSSEGKHPEYQVRGRMGVMEEQPWWEHSLEAGPQCPPAHSLRILALVVAL